MRDTCTCTPVRAFIFYYQRIRTCLHPYFVGRLHDQAVFLLEEGCLPPQVDRVLEEFGFPIGLLKVNDLSGTCAC